MLQKIILLMLFTFFSTAYGAPLKVNKAFQLTAEVTTPDTLQLTWQIAPGYYLYKSEFKVGPQGEVGSLILPPGQQKQDKIRGSFESYANKVSLIVPLKNKIVTLNIRYQGCSSEGFCYPPVNKTLPLNINILKPPQTVTQNIQEVSRAQTQTESTQDYSVRILDSKSLFLIILSFLGLGILLTFTPCVLPMIPILSAIIVGQGKKLSSSKAFFLSLTYVMGMALAYSIAGMLVALAGNNIQIALQNPVVIVLFSFLFVLLAISLFGYFELRLPNHLHNKIVAQSNKHQGGKYIGVFMMGAFSTLIVSPCVSAPLVGALAYIAESGDVMLGGVALLALGLGMGLPLLIIGVSEGKLLPKAGPWMNKIKQFFGILMLGLAIWMLQRVLPPAVHIFLWAMLAIGTAAYIWQLHHEKKIWRKLNKLVGGSILAYGLILMSWAFLGHVSVNPWPFSSMSAPTESIFLVVKNMDDLDLLLREAKDKKKQVLLDFYADWCTSCVLMDKQLFGQAKIRQALENFVLLRMDITKNDDYAKAVLKRFQVIAPPTILFFNTKGELLQNPQFVGEVNSKQFLADINELRYKTCENSTIRC